MSQLPLVDTFLQYKPAPGSFPLPVNSVRTRLSGDSFEENSGGLVDSGGGLGFNRGDPFYRY